MGQDQKKFYITDDGVIYRVDDTGEITELGNVDSLDTSKKSSDAQLTPSQYDKKIRYSLSEMEQLLCKGKGKGFNRFERKLLVNESSNIPALEYFVEFCGLQWVNILIARFERGDTFLEPILLKVSKNRFGPIDRLAKCKRPYSNPAIYHNLHNFNIPRTNDILKANPNSPYFDPSFELSVVPSEKSDGCLGLILIFIISTAAIIITLT